MFVTGEDCYQVMRREPMLSSRVYVRQRFRRLTREQVLRVIPVYHPIWEYRPEGDRPSPTSTPRCTATSAPDHDHAHATRALNRLDRSTVAREVLGWVFSKFDRPPRLAPAHTETVVWDGIASVRVVLDAHDRAPRRIVVHPTPGQRTASNLRPANMGAMFFAVLAVAAQLDHNSIREKAFRGPHAAAAKGATTAARPKVIDDDMLIFAKPYGTTEPRCQTTYSS